MTDISVLLSNGKVVQMHRVILAARSKYFAEQFRLYPKRRQITFPDLRPAPKKIRELICSFDIHCPNFRTNYFKQTSELLCVPAEILHKILSNFETLPKDKHSNLIGNLILTCKAFLSCLGTSIPRLQMDISKLEQDCLRWLYSEDSVLDFGRTWLAEKLLLIDTVIGMPARFKQLIEYNLNQKLINQNPFSVSLWFSVYRLSVQYKLVQLEPGLIHSGAIKYHELSSHKLWPLVPDSIKEQLKSAYQEYKGNEKCIVS